MRNVAAKCAICGNVEIKFRDPRTWLDVFERARITTTHPVSAARCYDALTQSQQLQPRHSSINLAAMAGRWYGLYPSSGVELLVFTIQQPLTERHLNASMMLIKATSLASFDQLLCAAASILLPPAQPRRVRVRCRLFDGAAAR